ncbi:DUF192 domain-containing protein [Candidatus Woesebacteria bacterium]|nr:DUF192 domain-containing protein [Candidatus Woesebacteria bacterium]QQG47233.1 MAG: DUF192 domain-containing protein [Candidatus Woesebacteria bacterium]
MKKVLIFFIILVLFLLGLSFLLPKSSLKTIKVKDKNVKVSLANTNELRTKGLGGVKSLPQDQGMLFNFDQKNIIPSFWMKDMLIGLDMIWIRDGKIIQIDKNIPAPNPTTLDSSLPLYTPKEVIDHVLEVNANWSDKNNVKVGDSVDLGNL